MEIQIAKSELSRLLSITENVVERKSLMPILANVLLEASEGELRASASDLEITALSRVKAKVKKEGSTTVNSKVLSELVRELPEGEVHLKLKQGERLEISCFNSKLTLIGNSAEEYPRLSGSDIKCRSTISTATLLEMINKTLYAASQDETRFNLNGVFLEVEKSKSGKQTLKMVATDGHRLATISRPVEGIKFEGGALLPRKGLAELRKFMNEDEDASVGIDIQEQYFVVETSRAKAIMRLVDAEYPKYSNVIPKEKGELAVINCGELERALRRISVFITEKGKSAKLELAKDCLKISSISEQLGEANETLNIDFKGKPFVVGFSAKYLIDIASSQNEKDSLVIELFGKNGPGKFYPQSDESQISVVMPMRIEDTVSEGGRDSYDNTRVAEQV
jgi:DNA polymerase-3 subunit beta